MTSDTPGWGQPPKPEEPAPASGGWPAELVPPGEPVTEPVPPLQAPAPEAAPAAADVPPAQSGSWGQPPAAAPAAPPVDDTPTQPVAPAQSGTWGQPPVTPAPAPAPAPAEQPAWGQPAAEPAPAPAPAPAAPASGGQWGAPPPQQPQQPQSPGYGAAVPPPAGGQWGAPPPQQPGAWAPPPGAAGGPPAGWQPAPAKSSNGCLKACLIVGIILVILAVVAFVGLALLGMKFASDMGVNPDGSMQQCEFISNDELAQVIDGQPTGMPLGGIVDATLGQLLDKRLLADASDCWLVDESSSGTGYTGRLALKQGGSFDQERSTAEAGGFYAVDMPGYGDQAFCTGMAETGSTGALVRVGGNVAYVSLISGDPDTFDFAEAPNGVLYSPASCEMAAAIAVQILR